MKTIARLSLKDMDLFERDTPETTLQELQDLRARLWEAEETLNAIRNGEVDALVVSGKQGAKVYTLQSAEQPYRILIEQMQEGAATLSGDGIILYCNLRLAEILRAPHEKTLAASFFDFLSPEDAVIFESLLQEGKVRSGTAELHLQAQDGGFTPVYLTVNPLPATEGHICLVVTDLTEQKRNEQIVADERLAHSILENTAEAIVVCDPYGDVLRANRAAHALCGRNPLRQPFAQMFPLYLDSDSAQYRADGTPDASDSPRPGGLAFPLSLALQGKTLSGIEARIALSEGKEASLLLTAGPLQAEQGAVVGCVLTLTDITQRKQAEAALRRHQADIENLNIRLRRSVQETHHRVKNNLQIISALAELQSGDTEGKPQDNPLAAALERIGHHSRSLAAVHDLLTLDATEGRDTDGLSTKAMLDKLIPLLQLTTGGRRLLSSIDDFRMPVREGASLAMLTSELVSNAVKHGKGEIEIMLQRHVETARLTVCDDGPGFPPDFDWSKSAHTGLNLIDSAGNYDLKGVISYENRPEGGARVLVAFPIAF